MAYKTEKAVSVLASEWLHESAPVRKFKDKASGDQRTIVYLTHGQRSRLIAGVPDRYSWHYCDLFKWVDDKRKPTNVGWNNAESLWVDAAQVARFFTEREKDITLTIGGALTLNLCRAALGMDLIGN